MANPIPRASLPNSSTVLILATGPFIGRCDFRKVNSICKRLLTPTVVLRMITNAFAIHSSENDAEKRVVLGLIAWFLTRVLVAAITPPRNLTGCNTRVDGIMALTKAHLEKLNHLPREAGHIENLNYDILMRPELLIRFP